MVIHTIFLFFSVILTFLFFIYGFHHYYLIFSSRKYKTPQPYNPTTGQTTPTNPISAASKPKVSVHLPIYNEKYVVGRLVEACIQMIEEYGSDLAKILVIDDSNDDTRNLLDELVKTYREKNYQLELIRRENREGYKAGALQNALLKTDEDFIAVFDADFIPPENFLTLVMPYLVQDEHLGILQTRWSHLNRNYNPLTKSIAIGIDVHFLIEQAGRFASRCFQNFNGSGGVIRKKALLEAGGWQSDTLAEDLDVSYRIQMLGYKFMYLKDLRCPGEIPPSVPSFKKQQARWACGSLQTAKKTLPSLLTDREISGKRRLLAFLHLTGYLVHPLMFISFLLTSLSTLVGADSFRVPQISALFLYGSSLESLRLNMGQILLDLVWVILGLSILVCTMAVWVSPIISLKIQGISISRNLSSLVLLFLLGFGISMSNTIEAGKALFSNRRWIYLRTPKYAVRFSKEEWRSKHYQISLDLVAFLEFLCSGLGCISILYAIRVHNLGVLPILIPYTAAYAFVLLLTIWQSK